MPGGSGRAADRPAGAAVSSSASGTPAASGTPKPGTPAVGTRAASSSAAGMPAAWGSSSGSASSAGLQARRAGPKAAAWHAGWGTLRTTCSANSSAAASFPHSRNAGLRRAALKARGQSIPLVHPVAPPAQVLFETRAHRRRPWTRQRRRHRPDHGRETSRKRRQHLGGLASVTETIRENDEYFEHAA